MASHEITTFYDVASPGLVTVNEARQLVAFSRPLLRWLSKDTLGDPAPYCIPTEMHVVDPRQLGITSPHALLLTRLPVIKNTDRDTSGVCVRSENGDFTAIVRIPDGFTTEPKLNDVLGDITHELAHGYGIGHCATSTCVMFPYRADAAFNSQRPFCGLHPLRRPKV
jgi:hypothetical protein